LSFFSGLEDWGDANILTQVLAVSQQEYLDSLKKSKEGVETKNRRSSSDSSDKNPDSSKKS
jgi:hypothetical protein